MKNKTVILLFLTVLSVISTLKAQERSPLKVDDFFNGGVFRKPIIDSWVGRWKSEDGKYIFSITKSLRIIKIERLNYSTEVLALKLIKTKENFMAADKIINYPIDFVTVGDNYARTSFKDPSTQTEGFMTLKKLNKNTLTVTISHLYSGKNQKGFFFPSTMVLKMQK